MSFAKPLELTLGAELQVLLALTQPAPVARSHSLREICCSEYFQSQVKFLTVYCGRKAFHIYTTDPSYVTDGDKDIIFSNNITPTASFRHAWTALLLHTAFTPHQCFLKDFFPFFYLQLWHFLLLFDMYKEKSRALFSYISALTAFLFTALQSAILHLSKVQLFVS